MIEYDRIGNKGGTMRKRCLDPNHSNPGAYYEDECVECLREAAGLASALYFHPHKTDCHVDIDCFHWDETLATKPAEDPR